MQNSRLLLFCVYLFYIIKKKFLLLGRYIVLEKKLCLLFLADFAIGDKSPIYGKNGKVI